MRQWDKLRIKCLVRKNLNLTIYKTAAQAIHAFSGLESVLGELLDPMMSVVVLGVSDAKFEEAKTTLVSKAEPFYLVKDLGYTEVAPGTETVLAFLEPDPRKL